MYFKMDLIHRKISSLKTQEPVNKEVLKADKNLLTKATHIIKNSHNQ